MKFDWRDITFHFQLCQYAVDLSVDWWTDEQYIQQSSISGVTLK